MSDATKTHHPHQGAARPAPSASARSQAAQPSGITPRKLLIMTALIAAAFFSAYSYASAKSATTGGAPAPGGGVASALAQAVGAPAGGAAGAAGGGCGMSGGSGGGGGCCGGGGAPVEGATTVAGGAQTINVDTSQGSFNPNVITAKAGVPIELTFSQAPGGCLSGVYFPDFSINEDLTGGPKTVKLPALSAGEYSFFCQMQMVSAKIVVQ